MADMRAGPRPDEVAGKTFPTSFRGFDTSEVRAYLGQVASKLAASAEREETLRNDLARARASLANPAIDETVLLDLLGDEAAKVLYVAKEAAADIRAKADANAAVALDQAHSEAERLRSEAHTAADRVVRDAEGVLAIRTAEADNAAVRLLHAAEAEAAKVKEGGLAEARSMVAEARAVRERMLGDLKRRVQRGETSMEVLRVGRERMLEAFGVVRDRLDDATHELATAEARARQEAEGDAAKMGAAALAVVEELALMEPVTAASASDEVVSVPGGEPSVEVGEPTGEVAAIVPIGGVVVQETDEAEERAPVFDGPLEAPKTGEVPTIAATGTDSNGIGRGRRRMLRLAEEPAVRAEEQRLAQMRYLHRPRTGGEAEVHLPEDGMVVVEPPRAGEAVRILRDATSAPQSRAPRPVSPPASRGLGGPAVTVLGRVPSPMGLPLTTGPVAPTVIPEIESSGIVAPPEAPRADAEALFARLRAERQPTSAAAALPQVPNPPVPNPPVPLPVDDEALLQARDIAVSPVEHLLAKRVKRLLQDHQNAVLDRLRAKRPPTTLELLGEIEDLLGPLAAAAEPLLGDAASAGAAAAGAPDTPVPSADLAGDIAANVVKDLRPRLEVAYSVADPEERVDCVNVAFREWRGDRVGRLVSDATHAAFARGHFVAIPNGTPLRWVADDGERPCPECEDNSLASFTPKGTPFPTGHRHPPAHSGCHCLLVGVSPP